MWKDDEYFYSVGLLRGIAGNYEGLYSEGFDFKVGVIGYHMKPYPFLIAEYKADFDVAFQALNYKRQKFVTLDKEAFADSDIEARGYYDIPEYRNMVYGEMARYLNGT